MTSEIERFEVKMLPGFKAKIAAVAQKEGFPLGEMIIRAACRSIGFPEDEAVPTRKLPGRKPTISAGAKRSRQRKEG